MTPAARTPRDRVNEALAFRRPDRTPRDFAAVPEIWQGLVYGTGRSAANLTSSREIP